MAAETLPSLEEVLAITDFLAEHPRAEAWITFISEGWPTHQRWYSEQSVCGSPGQLPGVNCTAMPHIESLIQAIRRQCDLPVLVYPNSGEVYDPVTNIWHPAPCDHTAADLSGLAQGGSTGWQ